MSQLVDLPSELLLSIADNLESERDINALAPANRRLYEVLNAYLYRHNALWCQCSALIWAAKEGLETTARRSLDAAGV